MCLLAITYENANYICMSGHRERQSSADSAAHYIQMQRSALSNTSLMFARQADLRGKSV